MAKHVTAQPSSIKAIKQHTIFTLIIMLIDILQLQAELTQALAHIYKVFSIYKAPAHTLDVCLDCCMSIEIEKAMRNKPLKSITRQEIYEYNTSAKSLEQPAREIKYFLPRMFELFANEEELHHSIELYFDRVGRAGAENFSKDEQAALNAVALAHFKLGLETWQHETLSPFQGNDAFAILLMWDYANVALEPLLDYWLNTDSIPATRHFVENYNWEYLQNQKQLNNAFADDRPRFKNTLSHWLNAEQTRKHFLRKILAIIDTNNLTPQQNDLRLSYSFDVVFDELSQ